MFVSRNLGVNGKGNLTIGGVDSVELAKKFGTPLYVMDIDLVRENCRKYKDALKKYCKTDFLVCFASKSFCCKEIYKIINEEGLGVDTVSIGEMYTANKAGFPVEKMCLHGNNKTKEELEYAVKNKIGRIVVDNLTELKNLNNIAKENNANMDILLRIKPGVDAHVHEYVTTGTIDSKFGFALETDEAMNAVKEAIGSSNLNLVGLHCHIGSQIFEIKPFLLATEKMLNFIKDIKEAANYEILELNLGGGFGISYIKEDIALDIENCIKEIVLKIEEKSKEFGLKTPNLIIEPGRSIVAQAGITLYTVGCRKEISNGKIYISVDGGMTDNPRYILYKSVYDAVVANKASEEKKEKVSIAGKCCESGDLIGENILLQHAEEGDILAVLVTGAYNYSMLSNYNRNLNPAVVFIENKECRIAVKRQTLDDLLRNDI